MTKQERLTGNRLIGEFVGKSFQMSHISDYKGCPDESLPPMKYHTDWNWFMEAWFLFRDLKFKKELHQFRHSDLKGLVAGAICYDTKEVAFVNLVNAIKWYNTTKH